MEKTSFNRQIEKRVRKHLRVNELFKKGDTIYVEDDLSRFFIDKIIGDLPKKFIDKPKKATKIVLKQTLDDVCFEFLEKIMFNKTKKTKKGLSVLKVVTDKEALLFAKSTNIKFQPNKKNKKIKDMLDKLEKLYPQTRYSLAKSIGSLR